MTNNGHKLTCKGRIAQINGICQECKNDVSGPPTMAGESLPAKVVARSPLAAPSGKSQVSVRVKPHIGTLLWDSYSILAAELRRLRDKVEIGDELDRSEAQKLSKYIEAMTRLAKEEREQEARQLPEDLTDEDLLLAAEQARKVLGKGDSSND